MSDNILSDIYNLPRVPKTRWTICSCMHIAQDHDNDGKCLICSGTIGTKCPHCGKQLTFCKGYDGRQVETK